MLVTRFHSKGLDELLVVQLISDKPDLYLREICQNIHELTGDTVSEAKICQLGGYTPHTASPRDTASYS